jgi:hypothetical protein
MPRYNSAAAESINRLLDSLPGLLLRYNQSQNELEFRREQLEANKQANLFEAVLSNNAQKIKNEEYKIDSYEENIKGIEEEVSQVVGALPDYSKDPNATASGSNIGNKILKDFTGNQKAILEESYKNINDLVDQRNEAKAKYSFYDDIKSNLNDLMNQSKKVGGNTAVGGVPDVVDPTDFSAYFDNVLTADNDPATPLEPGQYEKTDPMYGMYRRSFMNLAPSYQEVAEGSIGIYKLNETIRAQNEERITQFEGKANIFVAGGIDSLYDVDEKTGALTGLSEATIESEGYKQVVSLLKEKYNLDNEGIQTYVNNKLMDTKRAMAQSAMGATDLVTLDEDMDFILTSLSGIQYSLFKQEFDKVLDIYAETKRGAIMPTFTQPKAGGGSGGGGGSQPSSNVKTATQLLQGI